MNKSEKQILFTKILMGSYTVDELRMFWALLEEDPIAPEQFIELQEIWQEISLRWDVVSANQESADRLLLEYGDARRAEKRRFLIVQIILFLLILGALLFIVRYTLW